MTDDPRWNGTGYSPEKAWAEIRSKDSARESTARHPMRLRDYAIVGGAAIGLIAIPILVLSFFF